METIRSNRFIRFKLQADGENASIQNKIDALNVDGEFDLVNFFSKLKNYLYDINDYLFFEREDGSIFKGGIVVKSEWMKTHAKQQLAEFRYKERSEDNQRNDSRRVKRPRMQHTLSEYKVSDRIIDVHDDIVDVYEKLQDVVSRERHERADRAKIALLLGRLKTKGGLPLLVSLVENTTDKKEQGELSLRLKKSGKELLNLLEMGVQSYLPEQSKGYPIAKASFNFYTINKRPIDYTRKIKEINDRLRVDWKKCEEWCFGKNKSANDIRWWKTIKADVERRAKGKELLLGEMPMRDIEDYANLRQILKNILAQQRAEFSEMIQSAESYSSLQESGLYLFDRISDEDFDEYFDFSEAIEQTATKRNQTRDQYKQRELRTKINRLKKQRGDLLNDACRETRDRFVDYKRFAAFYRKVAQQHGRLYAQLKGIEKERNESQMISYWAMILQSGSKHKLVLVPKEKASELKNGLNVSEDKTSNTKLFWFESFSFRSLQKLCFSNIESGSNKFYSDLRNEAEFSRKYSFGGKFISGEFDLQGDEQKKIEFYKDVLSSRTAGKMLSISKEELKQEVLDVDFDCLDDFKVALERVSYKRMFTVNPNIIDALKSDFAAQVFDITSLDLRHEESCKDKETVFEYSDKMHTRIWKEFWSEDNEDSNFDVRLCPEITLLYRKPKSSRIAKYGADSTQRNRYLHEQLTLVTRFTERSNSPGRELSFLAEEDEKKIVENFNREVLKEDFRFALGIDNGEVELSTLGVYLPQFAQESNDATFEMLKKVDEFGFPTLTIRDLKYKEKDIKGIDRRVVQNPSYFIKEDLYCRTFGKSHQEYEAMFETLFERRNLLTLDLSTAKVISGHIVTNGDVVSLFNLWKRHAQRNIYAMMEHQLAEGSVEIELKRSYELSDNERQTFIDYLNADNKKYEKLSKTDKSKYVTWIYDCWNGKEVENKDFENVYNECKRKGNFADIVLYAVCTNAGKVETVVDVFDVRNVFKLRKDFDCLMSQEEIKAELNRYNVRVISDEELDLNLRQTKSSLVANVIGVIDFLYARYKEKFGGEGLVVSEGFGVSKVEQDLEKFSGNIYRLLERKLYQKFQAKGLVPPIKNILMFREEDNNRESKKSVPFLHIGNICFVDPRETSQNCPVCENGKLGHTEICPNNCGFKSEGIMHSNDGIAGYNIAKRGFLEFKKLK
ncbi:MAG: transposase [Bacteroidales bacterium]|nr:transposase [Bacteroidales bacterium]